MVEAVTIAVPVPEYVNSVGVPDIVLDLVGVDDCDAVLDGDPEPVLEAVLDLVDVIDRVFVAERDPVRVKDDV